MSEPLPSEPSAVEPIEPAEPIEPIAGDPPADPNIDPPADNWGENWRKNYAGDDEKMLKRLERYASPKAMIDGAIAAQNKISSGELKVALQPDATDEERTQWREENGIPSKAEDYEVNLPNDLVIGDEDRPMVDSFLESALNSDLHPDQVNKTLAWYYDHQDKMIDQQLDMDADLKQQGEDQLRVEWGTDYRRNLQIATNFLDSAPEGMKEQIMGSRLADGSTFGDNPAALNWLVDMSRQINPIATVVPGSGTNAVQAIETELASLKDMMGDRTSEYWKGAKAETNQARYRELVETMQKHG